MEEQTFTSEEGPAVGIDHLTRRILCRRYTILYTRVQLAEMFEKDLPIFTIDSYPPTGVCADGPLEGVGRDARKILSQRYGNLSLANFCEKLDMDLCIFTKD
ncbi:hypothetical protein OCU04_007320 [Sclerotinia nivalis]|uniref:Uncharacterized protein n=1 Tax=Sclerotinia nivalis TaxID=352851 RepID=A0A9X0ALJ3_9HELO|nr:hypothetical protein OCU04_007320 [Sclerotinia nivalis]